MIIIIEMKYYYPVQIEAIVMADLFDDELLMFVCVCVCVCAGLWFFSTH